MVVDDDAEMFCDGSHFILDLNSGIGNFVIRDGTTTRFTFDDAGVFTATSTIVSQSQVRGNSRVQPEKTELLLTYDQRWCW